jgi:hypothetical protein
LEKKGKGKEKNESFHRPQLRLASRVH